MKRSFLIAALAFLAFTANQAFAATALEALQTVRDKSPDAGTLVEMQAERGEPQPSQWTLLFNDPKARGGVREIVATGSGIISERTPLVGFAGTGAMPTIDRSRLKIDSSEAFSIANSEARKRQIGFHWIDYTLRADPSGDAPVWSLKLTDHMGALIGTIRISAETGNVLSSTEVAAGSRRDEDTDNSPSVTKPIGGVIGTVRDVTTDTTKKVSNSVLRAFGTVQEVLTGERTIGPKDSDE